MQATSTHNVISSDKVEGTSVYNEAGDKLGSIDELMIDKVSGKVHYAVLEFGGFLGMNTDRYPIPWGMLKYDTSKEGYVVPLDKANLRVPRVTPRSTCQPTPQSTGVGSTPTTAWTSNRAGYGPSCEDASP